MTIWYIFPGFGDVPKKSGNPAYAVEVTKFRFKLRPEHDSFYHSSSSTGLHITRDKNIAVNDKSGQNMVDK
jgi:hypothetical protein